MKKSKEQWKPKITNIFLNGEKNNDMAGIVLPKDHILYDALDLILGV